MPRDTIEKQAQAALTALVLALLAALGVINVPAMLAAYLAAYGLDLPALGDLAEQAGDIVDLLGPALGFVAQQRKRLRERQAHAQDGIPQPDHAVADLGRPPARAGLGERADANPRAQDCGRDAAPGRDGRN